MSFDKQAVMEKATRNLAGGVRLLTIFDEKGKEGQM